MILYYFAVVAQGFVLVQIIFLVKNQHWFQLGLKWRTTTTSTTTNTLAHFFPVLLDALQQRPYIHWLHCFPLSTPRMKSRVVVTMDSISRKSLSNFAFSLPSSSSSARNRKRVMGVFRIGTSPPDAGALLNITDRRILHGV